MIYTCLADNSDNVGYDTFILDESNELYNEIFNPGEFFNNRFRHHRHIGSLDYSEILQIYYEQVLVNLDPDEVAKKLENKVLIETDNSAFYGMRFIIAEWIKLFTKNEYYEVFAIDYNFVTTRKSDFCLKKFYEVLIDHNHGLDSLEGLKYYLKGEKLEKETKKFDSIGYTPDSLIQEMALCWYKMIECENNCKTNEFKLLLKRYE